MSSFMPKTYPLHRELKLNVTPLSLAHLEKLPNVYSVDKRTSQILQKKKL
jgi:hypothetical protein